MQSHNSYLNVMMFLVLLVRNHAGVHRPEILTEVIIPQGHISASIPGQIVLLKYITLYILPYLLFCGLMDTHGLSQSCNSAAVGFWFL